MTERRLPPRRNRRPRKKPPRKQTLQLSAIWIAACVVCGVFVVLLAGVGIRKLVVLRQQRNQAVNSEAGPIPGQVAAQSTSSDLTDQTATETAKPEHVSAPRFAKPKPGRTLPTTLYVGYEEGMYKTLDEALADSISGDSVRIQANRPVWLRAITLKGESAEKPLKITIEPSEDSAAVVYCVAHIPAYGRVISCTNVDLTIRGAHFVSNQVNAKFFKARSGRVHLDGCSFTRLPFAGPKHESWVFQADGGDQSFTGSLTNCFLRDVGVFQAWRLRTSLQAEIKLRNSTMCGAQLMDCHWPPPDSEKQGTADSKVSIGAANCTFANVLLWSGYEYMQGLAPEISIQMDHSIVVCRRLVTVTMLTGEYLRDVRSNVLHWEGRNNAYAIAGRGSLASFHGIQPGDQKATTRHTPTDLATFTNLFEGSSDSGSLLAPPAIADRYKWDELWKATPLDFRADSQSNPPLQKFTERGIKVGCDVSKLRVPPPATLKPFENKAPVDSESL